MEADVNMKEIPTADLLVFTAIIERGIKEGDLTDEGGFLSGWIEAARAEVARRAQVS